MKEKRNLKQLKVKDIFNICQKYYLNNKTEYRFTELFESLIMLDHTDLVLSKPNSINSEKVLKISNEIMCKLVSSIDDSIDFKIIKLKIDITDINYHLDFEKQFKKTSQKDYDKIMKIVDGKYSLKNLIRNDRKRKLKAIKDERNITN